jgi:hypothetical protein
MSLPGFPSDQARKPSCRPQPEAHAVAHPPIARPREDLVDPVPAAGRRHARLLCLACPSGTFEHLILPVPQRRPMLTRALILLPTISDVNRAGACAISPLSTLPASHSPTPSDNRSSSLSTRSMAASSRPRPPLIPSNASSQVSCVPQTHLCSYRRKADLKDLPRRTPKLTRSRSRCRATPFRLPRRVQPRLPSRSSRSSSLSTTPSSF